MGRRFRLALAAGALLALLVGASPVAAAAGDGADFGACVAHHARSPGGFSGDHNPGLHYGFSGRAGCPGH